jgi:hypothetical protein
LNKFGKQLLVSLGLLSGLCAPAMAQSPLQKMMQPTAAGDAAPRGVVTGQPNFYESSVSKQCGASPCTILFDAVPAGRMLAATNLNCAASYSSGSPPPEQKVLFGLAQNDNPKGFFTVTGTSFFAINEQIRVYFNQGHKPKAQALSLSAPLSTMVCTLSGTLLK